MIMRATVGICGKDIERVVETYHLMSERSFTHASPTLFNAKSSARLLLPCLYEGWLDRRHVWHSRDTQAVRHDQQNCWWCWPKHSLGMSTGYFHVITFLWCLFACQILYCENQRLFERHYSNVVCARCHCPLCRPRRQQTSWRLRNLLGMPTFSSSLTLGKITEKKKSE